MTAESNEERAIEVNRALLGGGAVLMAVGGLLCMAGGLAATAAVVGAARSWVQQWDEPPRTVARRRLAQARSAAVAGAHEWRQNGQLLAADQVAARTRR
jgi:hypothetical protein